MEAQQQQPSPPQQVGGVSFPPVAAPTTTTTATNDSQQEQPWECQFQVTKLRSWRTGYTRLLRFYSTYFCTLDPDSLNITNTWDYIRLVDWQVHKKEKEQSSSLLLQLDSGDKLKFATHGQASAIATCLLKYQDSILKQSHPVLPAQRWKRNRSQQNVVLQMKPHALCELEPSTSKLLQTYELQFLTAVSFPVQTVNEVLLTFYNGTKKILYTCDNRTLLTKYLQSSKLNITAEVLAMEPSTTVQEIQQRHAQVSYTTSWEVTKPPSGRRSFALSRWLSLGPTAVLERDGLGVVSVRPYETLYAIIVPPQSSVVTLVFTHETSVCKVQTYAVPHNRDAVVVSLMDHCPHPVIVSDHTQLVAYTLHRPHVPHSLFQPPTISTYALQHVYDTTMTLFALLNGEFGSDTQSEKHQAELKEFISTLEHAIQLQELLHDCYTFNGSVPTLDPDASSKQVTNTILGLFGIAKLLLEFRTLKNVHVREEQCGTLFQTILCLVQTSAAGYKCVAETEPFRECLRYFWDISDPFCKFAAFSILNCVLKATEPRDMETEYVNKNVILQCGGLPLIQGVVGSLFSSTPSELILMVSTDLLQNLLCSGADTTSPEHFSNVISELAHCNLALLSTLRSSTSFVIENTALLLHLLSTHAPEAAVELRSYALSSAVFLQHFYLAIFSGSEGQRFLSRYLCSLWLAGPMDCDEKRLLKRMVPHGFLSYLNMPSLSQMEEDQLDELERDAIEGNVTEEGTAAAAATNTARLRSRIVMAARDTKTENFRIFFHVLTQDHSLADLIWSQQTRRELRICLESELESIRRERDARGGEIAWNHQQFRVPYPSLENEVKVGNVYMRLWLQAGDGFIRSWDEPLRLFEHLFRRFLCEVDRNTAVTVMCIRCLERLYAIHASKIGPFTDVMILVRSMAATQSVETQHRLLGLVATVLGVQGDGKDERYEVADVPENAEQLLNIESISQLCQFVAWGHTNGDQVANILTRVLSVGMNGKAMLTDGTDSKPTSDSTTTVAGDVSCPPVWFVAATARIPPPPELVKGPFRISDLVKMMEAGEISPYDLVTTTHVEEYDIEAGEDAVQEAQIDTGKWKRLNQVWQLRWQLCTDGSSTEIYSPSDVSLLALKALTRLVDLHRSLDSRGVPFFPIPAAKRILCGTSRDPTLSSEQGGTIANPLPIVCQALLCNDSRIVSQASELIYKLCLHNDRAVAKLYLTGVYFFVMSCTGSNFSTLARLLHETHLKQHFRSGFAAAATDDELPMKERSVLGNLLPEGLLFILTNYGPERFAEVFVSNADNPEAIWTFEMRKHLIEMIRQHLGDFPLRLFQDNTTEYEYCPIPGVAYKRLEEEIFCHNYYLHNLCDEERFPDWPISEPVEVFRACLERFKQHLDRDETAEEEKLETARQTLDLKVGDGSKELRKSYRSLARKFHPDKNPAGRDTFEAIQTSYELLLPLVERGELIRVFAEVDSLSGETRDGEKSDGVFPSGKSQVQTMKLLIKTQLLICRKNETEMARLKYPAYAILLRCIRHPGVSADDAENEIIECEFTKLERALFVQSAVELIFRTCLISPLNSEELVVEGGVPALAALLDFYVKLAMLYRKLPDSDQIIKEKTLASEETIGCILAYTVHTLAGVAFYENGRAALTELDNRSTFFVNWKRCADDSLFPTRYGRSAGLLVKRYAFEGVAHVALDADLQACLVRSGILWPLLRAALTYDPTLDRQSSQVGEENETGISVASTNLNARHSIRALGVLSGIYGNSPENKTVNDGLCTLLTGPVARMLRNERAVSLLEILNQNIERADIIWNVRMRDQLERLIADIEKNRPDGSFRSIEEELKGVAGFKYDALANEARIGGIYVRVFNKGGKDSLSYVENPNGFLNSVVTFVARSINKSDHDSHWFEIQVEDGDSRVQDDIMCSPVTSSEFLLGVDALKILCRNESLVDDVLSQPTNILPTVLISLLELPLQSEAFDTGCDILYSLSPKQPFADAIAGKNVLWRLLQLLERPEPDEEMQSDEDTSNTLDKSQAASKRKSRAWGILEALTSSPSIAGQILSTTAWIELLGVLAGYSSFTKLWIARAGASKTFSRLLWDPSTGAQADAFLQRFLPPALIFLLKEDSEGMLKSFDGKSDTPELIWDASMRGELRKVLGGQIDEILSERKKSKGKQKDAFELDPSVFVRYSKLEGELYIGGVYVSRFLKEPTYNLRDPAGFLELLLHRWTKEIELYTCGGEVASPATETTVAKAGTDILDLVTNASVYLCRVKETLCDKLAGWGYMSRSILFLDQILAKGLTGSPLVSIIRLLHVAADRKPNVEAIALVGHSDGRQGAVDLTMKSIETEGSLHADCAFMVEFLRKIFKVALGDLSHPSAKRQLELNLKQPSMADQNLMLAQTQSGFSAGPGPVGLQAHLSGQPPILNYNGMPGQAQAVAPGLANPGPGHVVNTTLQPSPSTTSPGFVATAPSPAPGEGPVRKKVSIGDDPLGMMQAAPSQVHATPPSSMPPSSQAFSGGIHSGLPLQGQAPTGNFGGQQMNQQQQQQRSYGVQRQVVSQYQPPGNTQQFQHPKQGSFIAPQQGMMRPQRSPQQQQLSYSQRSQMAQVQQPTQYLPNQQTVSAPGAAMGYAQSPGHPTYHIQNQQQFQHTSQSPGSSFAGAGTSSKGSGLGSLFKRTSGSASNQAQSFSQSTQGQQANFQRQPPMMQQQQPPQPVIQQQSNGPANSLQGSQGNYGQPTAQAASQLTYGSQAPQSSFIHRSHTLQGSIQQQRATLVNQVPPGAPPNQAMQPGPNQTSQASLGSGTFQGPGAFPSYASPMPPSPMIQQQSQLRTQVTQANSSGTQANYMQSSPMSYQHPQPGQTVGAQVPTNQMQPTNGQMGAHGSSLPPNAQPPYGVPLQHGAHFGPSDGLMQQQQPIVETVPEEPVSYAPKPVEGSGIDARSAPDPKVTAEQHAASTGGAPGAALGRVPLLEQALACKLCEFLIASVLENPKLRDVRDPAAAKLHSIDLVKLLSQDPGYGPKFKLVLDEIPAWKKYKSQDHSLLITGHEQKADYFLTDGSSGETKLLTDK